MSNNENNQTKELFKEEQVLFFFFLFGGSRGGLVQTWSNHPTGDEFSILCGFFSEGTHSRSLTWEVKSQPSGGTRRTQDKRRCNK